MMAQFRLFNGEGVAGASSLRNRLVIVVVRVFGGASLERLTAGVRPLVCPECLVGIRSCCVEKFRYFHILVEKLHLEGFCMSIFVESTVQSS